MQRYRVFDRDNVQVAEYELDDAMAPALLAGFRAELIGAQPGAAEVEAPQAETPQAPQAQQDPVAGSAPQPVEQVVTVREAEPVQNPQQ